LGYNAIQSGLMIMPQALAAMSLKMFLPRILQRFGYRQVLVWNTIVLGIMLALFSTIDVGTPAWADCFADLRLRLRDLDAVHQHEYPGGRRCLGRRGQFCQHHCQYRTAPLSGRRIRRGARQRVISGPA
jgi:hypothetical protein